MKTILVIFGTRPEAIKLAPLIHQLKNNKKLFEVKCCVTAQHRQMLDQVLDFFEIQPDLDLNLMQPNQTLPQLTAFAMSRLSSVLEEIKPALVLVQGDTTTAFVGTLAAFYQKIPVGHVEAGLRTHDIYAPFPEEANRALISVIAQWHFAPTETAARTLEAEGVPKERIFMTGNTVVDAFHQGLAILENNQAVRDGLNVWFHQTIPAASRIQAGKSRLILVTGHRRESFGDGFEAICSAIRELSQRHPNDSFVYPVHLNPNVQAPAHQILGGLPNISLLEPIEYPKMLYLLSKSYLILTDSGGIQEEAPSLKIPVLVMRDKTERPEGVALGAVRLVGNRRENILREAMRLLEEPDCYRQMQIGQNPYGDGKASRRIAEIIEKVLSS